MLKSESIAGYMFEYAQHVFEGSVSLELVEFDLNFFLKICIFIDIKIGQRLQIRSGRLHLIIKNLLLMMNGIKLDFNVLKVHVGGVEICWINFAINWIKHWSIFQILRAGANTA